MFVISIKNKRTNYCNKWCLITNVDFKKVLEDHKNKSQILQFVQNHTIILYHMVRFNLKIKNFINW